MKIIYDSNFCLDLDKIVDFIAKDSTQRAENFQKDVFFHIEKIPFMPFGYPKNRYFDDEKIRNLIFKGYIIVFKIDKQNAQIIVFAMYKHNIPNF